MRSIARIFPSYRDLERRERHWNEKFRDIESELVAASADYEQRIGQLQRELEIERSARTTADALAEERKMRSEAAEERAIGAEREIIKALEFAHQKLFAPEKERDVREFRPAPKIPRSVADKHRRADKMFVEAVLKANAKPMSPPAQPEPLLAVQTA